MAHSSVYLYFNGKTEEAISQYKKTFRTEFSNPIMKLNDVPPKDGTPPLPETDKNKVVHVAMPIPGGMEIMANDMLESTGRKLVTGNNFTFVLSPDTREEADRLYIELSDGGTEGVPPA